MEKKFVAILISAVAIIAAISVMGTSASAAGGRGAVYIIDNSATGNHVMVYSRASDGKLSFAHSVSAHGPGTGVALASQGAVILESHFLLVVDAGSNEITVFSAQGTNLVFASKVDSHGPMPISLAVHGNWVYVLDAGGNGNIAGFVLSSSGILSYIHGSNRPLSGQASPSPEQIGFSPDGAVLLVTEKATNIIDTYTVSSSGVASAPTTHSSAGGGPYGFAFADVHQLIVSEAVTNTMSSYILSDNGNLQIVSGALPTFGVAPCWVVINPGETFTYVTNTHTGTISAFSISRSGAIELTSSVAAKAAIPALDMAFGGQFLYVRNGALITGYEASASGSLASVTSVSGIPTSATGLAAS